MADFLSILSIYYLCDAMAVARPMTMQEMLACADTYEAVKSHFLIGPDLAPLGTAARAAQMQQSYLAFLDWEAANADLVEDMQAQARLTVRGLEPAAGW